MKTALITGVTGQDGSYLAELLAAKGYRVCGLTRDIFAAQISLDVCIQQKIELIQWDYNDSLDELLLKIKPTEIYNFAGYSSGQGMYDEPIMMGELNGLFVTKILQSISSVSPKTRFCQASSSEVFGMVSTTPQKETTPRNPRSPYGAAKQYADSMVNIYRQNYGVFAASAILFNHESVRRSTSFISRKISSTVAKIKLGKDDKLILGNLDAQRDWGFAGDYVNAMHLMLQQGKPDDYVISTGKLHSVRELCNIAFSSVDLDYRDFVDIEPSFYRDNEPVPLMGDSSRACVELNWSHSMSFAQLIKDMVQYDLIMAKGS